MEQFFIIAASEGFKRRVHLGKQRFFYDLARTNE
jgi:hypothetical protein